MQYADNRMIIAGNFNVYTGTEQDCIQYDSIIDLLQEPNYTEDECFYVLHSDLSPLPVD